MLKVATLGPAGTFSEIATRRYISADPELQGASVHLYRSIKQAFRAVGKSCDRSVLPIENLSEGFVQILLDLLLTGDLELIGELYLPIQFGFVANTSNLDQVQTVFVQFMAKGQCSGFLERLTNAQTRNTDSNIESLEQLSRGVPSAGAIVPQHAIDNQTFPTQVDNVGDYPNNSTRFVVLAPAAKQPIPRRSGAHKTSLIILDDNDHPGLLVSLLKSFSQRGINLCSIMSRPTGESIGKYHFFLDIEGHREDQAVATALAEISRLNKVKVIGSYPKGKSFLGDAPG